MPKYQLADPATKELANEILFKFATADRGIYQEIIDQRVRIDILFAYGDRDEESGEKLSDAITHKGNPALGLCEIRNIKLRAAGLGDVVIYLDADHWDVCGERQREALLDHELFHIDFARDPKSGDILRDDLQRPKIKMRKHCFDFGWFKAIAARHGEHSVERIQAKQLADEAGQYFWGEITGSFLSKAAK